MTRATKAIAIIVAAGRGERAGGGVPKQYRSLGGKPLLRHSLEAFASMPEIARIVVAIAPGDEARFAAASAGIRTVDFAIGGADRQSSVKAALEALADDPPDVVLIHDAARPFASRALIRDALEGLADADGAAPALPVEDTLKRETGSSIETVDRSDLRRVQTPQVFRYDAILRAIARRSDLRSPTILRSASGRVSHCASRRATPTISRSRSPPTFARAEAVLAARLGDVRTGQGFDVHAFEPGDRVRLCGVDVPHSARLAGHSDADVALHALTDAVLGALGAGDIGRHFPPTDERWRGADSARFLAHAASLVAARGGLIAHLDVTIVCERPKIAPYAEAMAERVAEIAGVSRDRVGVKGTTTEGLGFTGRREGIAALATATIRLPFQAP